MKTPVLQIVQVSYSFNLPLRASQEGFPSENSGTLKLPRPIPINRPMVGGCEIPKRDSLKHSHQTNHVSLEIRFFQLAAGLHGMVDLPKHTQANGTGSGIHLVVSEVSYRWQ